MRYLTEKDLGALIKDNQLRELSESDAQKYDDWEEAALATIDGYINQRYNTENEYAKQGIERNSLIKRLATDIFAYEMFSRASVDAVPDNRMARYEDAIKTLIKLSDGTMNVNLVPRDSDYDSDSVNKYSFGSYKRVNNPVF